MSKKPIELEKLIFADGWKFKNQTGSHRHYIHPNLEKSQYLFIVRIFQKVLKFPF